jgi:ABC-2 type transport system ATP-binding protein
MLRITELRKSFGSLVAVDGVSLSVARGEVFGLLGPNGAGKSTTIGMAIGLLAPDSGSVEIEGAGSPRDAAARRQIGVAPQSLALYDELSGEENLLFFGRIQGLSGSLLKTRVTTVLQQVGLAERRRDRVAGYSGGMKRRLNLAAAIVHDPPLLLLDEPTAGVDPQSRNSILDLVRDMASAGKTVVYTTHYMEEAQKLCKRVAIIDKGRILAMGNVDELIHTHGGESVVTLKRGDAEESVRTRDPLASLQLSLGAGDVTSVRIDRPDLETVFLGLTGRRLRD